jgi:uncharacterized membrane protein YdjX (TVP38/TMEM64 family)
MDARAWRAVGVTIGMFVIVGIMLVVGRLYYGSQINAFIDGTLGQARRTHLGLWVTILVFTVTSFVGVPQFVLIAACVVAFKPEHGFWYAWIATIVSGAANYFVGWLTRAQTQKRFGGATGGRFTHFMGKNGFLASFLIRNVPSAPFIVVNMAFGAARVGFWAFLGGLALGVLPKTAVVAFGGDSIMDAFEGKPGTALLLAVAGIAVWFGGVVVIRWLVRRWDERKNGKPDGEDDPPSQN